MCSNVVSWSLDLFSSRLVRKNNLLLHCINWKEILLITGYLLLSTKRKKRCPFFWDVTLCHWLSSVDILKALWSFEMLGTACPITQHHTPEGCSVQQHCNENLKCHKFTKIESDCRFGFGLRGTNFTLIRMSKHCLVMRVTLTLRSLTYIYGAPILDVSRSHTTTQHSR